MVSLPNSGIMLFREGNYSGGQVEDLRLKGNDSRPIKGATTRGGSGIAIALFKLLPLFPYYTTDKLEL